MRVYWAALIAVLGGFAEAAAFPRAGIWPLAFVGVAALSYTAYPYRARRAAWLGFLFGLAFMCPLLHWTGVYVGAVPWLILSFACAAFYAALGAMLTVLQRLRFAPLWMAAAWVFIEACRDRFPFGGFPWGRLAFSQSQSPLRWFAALGGAPLVSFAVALGGSALVVAIRTGLSNVDTLASRFVQKPLLANVALVVAVPVIALLAGIPLHVPTGSAGGSGLRVALIQGNVPQQGLESEQRAREVLDNHVAQTMRLVAEVKAGTVPRPDLVLWPEDSSDVDPYTDPLAYKEIQQTVDAIGAPILVGAITQAPHNDRYNVGILWSPTTGPGAQYVKRHPVPFGEYIPLRSIASKISSATNLVTQDMLAGHGNGLLKGGPVPIGDVICFEVAYDSLVQSSVSAGAQLLVVQTNNATFGYTPETYQQLAMSQLRAVETGRTVLQVATTGKSAIIDPNGKIEQESGKLFTPDTLYASVQPRTAMTLADEIGAWPEYVLSVTALVAVGWYVRRWVTLRDRSKTGPPRDGDPAQQDPQPEMVNT